MEKTGRVPRRFRICPLFPIFPTRPIFLICPILIILPIFLRAQARPARIVSLVPAVTEMVFALGAGPQVVGVSSFDEYPPEVATRAKVGALIDPDVERILSLRPDLVIVYATQTDLRTQLERAEVPLFLYEHAGLADITMTIRQLGQRLAATGPAATLATQIESSIAGLRTRVAGRARPRTLLVFSREADTMRGIYASGGRGFLHDMLVAAGGENVFDDVDRQSVQATTELILARAPEVILEVRTAPMSGESSDRTLRSWNVLSSLPAVRMTRVHLLPSDEFVIPGPRVGAATRRFAELLHPEAFK
jgi:iron complex transport system substrate-binding protein